MAIQKTTWIIMISLAMLTGFLLLINDVQTNYNVPYQTNYSDQVNEVVNGSVSKLSTFDSQLHKQFENTNVLQFLGDIPGTLLYAIKLPIDIAIIAFNLVALGISGITGINSIVATFLTLLISLVMGFSILRVMLGRSGPL